MASGQAAADIGVRRRAAHDAEEGPGWGRDAGCARGRSTTPDVARLVAGLQAEYVVIYGGPDGTPMTPGEFQPPHGASWLPLGEEPVAMGGWRFRPDVTGAGGVGRPRSSGCMSWPPRGGPAWPGWCSPLWRTTPEPPEPM
ncbi:MAG: hypothetical protein R2731_17780 [Nocardioides sp.]